MQYLADKVNFTSKVQSTATGYRAAVTMHMGGTVFTEYGRTHWNKRRAHADISEIIADLSL